MTSFIAALEFLTRVRLRGAADADIEAVARAQAWFPAVGLLIGLAALAVDRLAMRALPPASVDVLVVATLAVVTGALHLEGLADAADGLLGGHDRASRLAIMHDVHAGNFAIVAVVLVLALKWAGLNALPAGVRVEALVLAPCLSRLAMLVAVAAFPYARSKGMGAAFHARAWPAAALLGAGTGIAASAALLGAGGLLPVAFAVACALAFGAVCQRAVGGMTGDLYGATVEISEALVLLFVAALAQRGWIEALALS